MVSVSYALHQHRLDTRWAAAQPLEAWRTLTVRDSEKGAVRAEYLHARVWGWDGCEPEAHCWHMRVRGEVSHYCLSNAPAHTPWCDLARAQAQRFFIEHNFREAKSDAAWPITRCAAGMPGITLSPW